MNYNITDQTEIVPGTRLVFKSRSARTCFAGLYEINNYIADFASSQDYIEVERYDNISRRVTAIKGFNYIGANSTSKISFPELKTYFDVVTDSQMIAHTEYIKVTRKVEVNKTITDANEAAKLISLLKSEFRL